MLAAAARAPDGGGRRRDAVGVEPAVLDDLIESDRGELGGAVARSMLAEARPELFAAFEAADPEFAFPGGESIRSQVQRTRRALAAVAGGPQPGARRRPRGHDPRGAASPSGSRLPPERALAHGEAIVLDWGQDDRGARPVTRPPPAAPTVWR